VNTPLDKATASKGSNTKERGILILDGIVQGNRLVLESTLAGYLSELGNSPFFDQLKISKKSFESYQNEEGLRFTARLNLL
jgi:hypothetical protein